MSSGTRVLSLSSAPAFPEVKERLIAATGLAYYESRDDALARIIGERLMELNLANCWSYIDLLNSPAGGGELRTMSARLAIGETYFFRNQEHFDALRKLILPDILRRQASEKRLYIWSAGCSSGAEPYSISILLRREFAHLTAGWDIRILGTDISDILLAQAREGKFTEWALRSTPADLKESCFRGEGASRTVAPEYKERVSFEYHNLIDGGFPPPFWTVRNFHLILCRNVLIYFSPHGASRIIQRFHQSLAESGWLVVGPAETDIAAFRSFFHVNCGGPALYQKRSGEPAVQSSETKTLSLSFPAFAVEPALAGEAINVAAPPEPEKPASVSALANIRLLANQGEFEKAARCCEQIREDDSLNPLVYFYHAMVVDQVGDSQHAKTLLRKAIYLDRKFVLGHYHLGLTLQKESDARHAAQHFRIVLDLLSGIPDENCFTDGDGVTARDLKELTKLHLEVLET